MSRGGLPFEPSSLSSSTQHAPLARAACFALALANVVAVAVAVAVTASPAVASADERPYDAPLERDRERNRAPAPREAPQGDLPAVPPEYLHHDGDWLQVHFHPSMRDRVRGPIAAADALRAELRAALGRDVLERVEVRIAAVPAEMSRLSRAALPAYASTVALADSRLVLLSGASPLSLDPPDLARALRHALAHLALDEAVAGRATPRFLHEGFAVAFEGPRSLDEVRLLASAAAANEPFRVGLLDEAFASEVEGPTLLGAQAVDLVRFLQTDGDGRGLHRLVDATRAGEPFERALVAAAGSSKEALEARWASARRRHFVLAPVAFALALAALVFVALRAVAWRRSRRAVLDEPEAEPRSEREPPRRTPLPALVQPLRTSEPALPVLAADACPAERRSREPREPKPAYVVAHRAREAAVPKIEHGGRWHTLH